MPQKGLNPPFAEGFRGQVEKGTPFPQKFLLSSPSMLVNPSAISTLRWHFDFYIVKIGMPQKGLKKDDGVRGRREKLSLKVFLFFPDHNSTFLFQFP